MWVLKADLQASLKLFQYLPESLMSPDEMKRYFHDQVYPEEFNKGIANTLWEKYIEIIVLKKG